MHELLLKSNHKELFQGKYTLDHFPQQQYPRSIPLIFKYSKPKFFSKFQKPHIFTAKINVKTTSLFYLILSKISTQTSNFNTKSQTSLNPLNKIQLNILSNLNPKSQTPYL